jgi:hypothetical protein
MKYDILKDFKGSQDGRRTESFMAGSQAELSDYLAGIVVPEGWARQVGESPETTAMNGAPETAVRKPPRSRR